jgi:hypothetical protein
MADTQSSTPDEPSCCPALNLTLAFLLLRVFMGVRLVFSAFEKMGYLVGKATSTLKEALTFKALGDALALKAWIGPSGFSATDSAGTTELVNEGFGDGKMWPIAKVMIEETILPAWMVKPFLLALPYAMLIAGLLILLGLLNRVAWWLAGLIWFSLAFGQMLLPDEGTIQWLSLYVFMCALALCLVEHNRIRITKF